MSTTQAREPDGLDAVSRARLSEADRALMMAVAERELAQGKISFEEYADIRDRCHVSFAQALNRVVDRVKSVVRPGGGAGSAPKPTMTPRHA